MAQDVRRWSFTVQGGVRSLASPMRFLVEMETPGQVFVRLFRLSATLYSRRNLQIC